MVENKTPRKMIFRIFLALLVLMISVIAAQKVLAALYTINTNDNPATVQEWFNQGVPIWQADEVGDVENPKDDIVNTWVATGNDAHIYFMMELAGAPALEDMLHSAIAYLDCDGDGDNSGQGDPDDVMVIYHPHQDTTFIFKGDQSTGGSQGLDETDGQRVDQYVEWRIPIQYLPPTNPLLQSTSDCQHGVGLRFITGASTTYPGVSIDETTPFEDYNIPTAVTLNKMDSQQGIGNHYLIYVFAFLLLSSILLAVYLQQRIRRNIRSSE